MRLSEQVGMSLKASREKETTAESSTRGSLAKAITDIYASSAWIER
ncbi:CinA family protein, partial [Salmonella enterica subsp. enterica serovar Infantis]